MAKEKAQGVEPYRMPYVEIGWPIHWYPDQASDKPEAAIVTAIGNDNITLGVLGEGFHNFHVKEGVRHRGHPNRELVRAADQGVWDYIPFWKKMIDAVGVT